MKNYYEILQVNKNASKEIIKNAYVILSKEQTLSGEDKKDLEEAYSVLSNDFLREQYNKEYENENDNVLKKESYRANLKKDGEEKQNKKEKKVKKVKGENKETNEDNEKRKKHKLGSIMSLFDIIKDIFRTIKNGDIKKNIKNWNKKDTIALVSAIVIVILLGIILWFIPFTHELMADFIFLKK